MRNAFVAFMLIALPAAAQQSSPQQHASAQPMVPEVMPEARQAARELFASVGGASLTMRTLDAMRSQMAQLIQRQGKVDDLLLPDLKAHVGELQDMLADLYAAHYSITELRELRAFLPSPLGQEMGQVGPQMEAESFAVTRTWSERVALETIAKHEQELRQRGMKL